MEIEYSGIDESLVKWRYNTEPWHIAYITDLIAKWESDKAKENTYVKHMSTVAVRPVVHCKDCAHHKPFMGAYKCDVFDWVNTEDDYCSFGERRTDEF